MCHCSCDLKESPRTELGSQRVQRSRESGRGIKKSLLGLYPRSAPYGLKGLDKKVNICSHPLLNSVCPQSPNKMVFSVMSSFLSTEFLVQLTVQITRRFQTFFPQATAPVVISFPS